MSSRSADLHATWLDGPGRGSASLRAERRKPTSTFLAAARGIPRWAIIDFAGEIPGHSWEENMRSLIRYKTKPEHADENQRLVEKVYEELAAKDPGGVKYATLRLQDGVTFVHIFMTDTEDSPNTLTSIAAFAEFQKDLAGRCDEPPMPQSATVVGSYRLFNL